MFKHYSKVILRCPINSLNHINEITDLKIEVNELFKVGLFLASPVFLNEYEKRNYKNDKQKQKIFFSLLKYWFRSCSRPTPYGVFGGCCILKTSKEESSILLKNSHQYNYTLRLDMNFVSTLTQSLLSNVSIKDNISYELNNSIYRIGDVIRYVEYKIENNSIKYYLSEIEINDYLSKILEVSSIKWLRSDLISLLINYDSSLDKNDIALFIDQLIENQILIPSIYPTITGINPISQIIKNVEGYLPFGKFTNLEKLLLSPIISVNYYKKLEAELKNLNLIKEIPLNTIQTDLFLTLKENSVLNTNIVDKIISQFFELKKLSRPITNKDVLNFKANFLKRYDSQEIPLSLALDMDIGIGYGNNIDAENGNDEFTDDLFYQEANIRNKFATNDKIRDFSLLLYNRYINDDLNQIIILEKDLADNLPDIDENKIVNGMFLMGNLISQVKDRMNENNFEFFINGQGGSSGANLLSRFAYGQADIEEFVREIIQNEENFYSDCIFAEIVHLPNARIGNVLLRPLLRRHEIPYIGRSGANINNQININDLLVSVKNDKIVLRSKKLDKIIIPRLTSAHNYTNSDLPIYKFLCDIQNENQLIPGIWDWGVLESFEYLPRVSYKNLILKRERWIIKSFILENMNFETDESIINFFKDYRLKRKMPLKVLHIEGDNELYIDLENINCLKILIKLLKTRDLIRVEEYLQNVENCVVYDENKSPYVNEIIIPIINKDNFITQKNNHIYNENINKVKRLFLPSEEWLYLKVYSGKKTADDLLVKYLNPLLEENTELCEKFFFIRYSDSNGSHLRLRFYNSDTNKNQKILTLISSKLKEITPSVVYSIQIDSYERELERYHSVNLEITETLFYISSIAILKIIDCLKQDEEGDRYRLLISLRLIDRFLDDFKLNIDEKRSLINEMSLSYFDEFGGSKDLRLKLKNRYRNLKKDIFSFLNISDDEKNNLLEINKILNERSIKHKELLKNILSDVNYNKKSFFNILSSYIHMDMNRLFWGQQRKHELLIYSLLENYYNSINAIKDGSTNK